MGSNKRKEMFWKLSGPESNKKLAEWIHGEMEFEQVTCPVDEDHMRAGKRTTNLKIELPNIPVDDFVWTWYSECLIQDHVLKILKKNKLTGFEVKPVKARFKGKAQKKAPKLWELVITGWAGMAPPESGIHILEYCSACGLRTYSCFKKPEKLIKESQWDGSDFFMVWPLPGYIFISDRVAQIIKENVFSGAQALDIKKLKCMWNLGGGRLSYVMPDERAKKLGEPLGIY